MEWTQSSSHTGLMQHRRLERAQRGLPSSFLRSSRTPPNTPNTSPIPTRSTETSSVTTNTATEADAKPRGYLAQIDEYIARLPNRQSPPPPSVHSLHRHHHHHLLRPDPLTDIEAPTATSTTDKENHRRTRHLQERRARKHAAPPARQAMMEMDNLADGLGAMSVGDQGRRRELGRPQERGPREAEGTPARRLRRLAAAHHPARSSRDGGRWRRVGSGRVRRMRRRHGR